MNSLQDMWQQLLHLIEEQTSQTAINSWFSDAVPLSFDGERLVLYFSSDFKIGVIQKSYLGVIDNALRKLMGSDVLIKVEMTSDEKAKDAFLTPTQEEDNEEKAFSFENFVVGESNRFAHAAAVAVAENPGKVYNPLFIYGNSGLGKTHLLHAISNHVHRTKPHYHIVYVTGENFTNEIISAIRNNTQHAFREKYRQADILLVDDIQFISRSESTQEEFFHTFNVLHDGGKQIVLISDRPPRDMMLLEDRLRTRFEWGLIADIKPPEYETRMAIVSKKAESLGLFLNSEECNLIANYLTNNIRQIEGVIKAILAERDLMGQEVNPKMIENILHGIGTTHPGLNPTPKMIIEEVSSYTSVSERDIRGPQQSKDIAWARHICCYLIRKLTEKSLVEIGQEFQGRDHTTVRKSVQNVENRIQTEPDFKKLIDEITENITNK